MIERIFLLVSFLSLPLFAQAGNSTPISEVVEEHIDVTGDGSPDTLMLSIHAKNWHAPVRWSFVIKSGGMSIYEYEQDDAQIDEIFSHPSEFEGCKDYLSCKKKYYLKDKFKFSTDDLKAKRIKPIDAGLTEDEYASGIDTLVKEFKIPEEKAKKYIQSAVIRMKSGKQPAIHFLNYPEAAVGPYIYIPEVKKMILCSYDD